MAKKVLQAGTPISLLASLIAPSPASAETPRPDQTWLQAIYKKLVETDTSMSSGGCTLAAHLPGDSADAAESSLRAAIMGLDVTLNGNGAHGTDERIRIVSVLQGHGYDFALIKRLAAQP